MTKFILTASKLAGKLNPYVAVITTTISVVQVGKKVYDYLKE